jgi:DNA-binding NarL/FixJ family response regulator
MNTSAEWTDGTTTPPAPSICKQPTPADQNPSICSYSAAVLLADDLVAAGEPLLSPTATRGLISHFLAAPTPGEPAAPAELDVLTAREREVVTLVAMGLSNDDIAEKLYVSPLTAKTHVNRAMMKLGARDRAQLVVAAYQSGLVRAGDVP